MWLVGGDSPSGFVGERRLLAVTARADVVVVQQLVVSEAEEDEIVELGLPALLVRYDVVRVELVRGGAAGVLAVA